MFVFCILVANVVFCGFSRPGIVADAPTFCPFCETKTGGGCSDPRTNHSIPLGRAFHSHTVNVTARCSVFSACTASPVTSAHPRPDDVGTLPRPDDIGTLPLPHNAVTNDVTIDGGTHYARPLAEPNDSCSDSGSRYARSHHG